jgi:hypothetical protein
MRREWECPFCNKASIITDDNCSGDQSWFDIPNAHGSIVLQSEFIVCPNPKCREFTLSASMGDYTEAGSRKSIKQWLKRWPLVPASQAKVFPSYVPKPILDDYVEACLIRDLSPKASATLSRRCLQGMIRDFWKIQKGRLIDEIDELKGRVDPLTWEAIDAVRKVGNIGAHMEKDINVIIDVDPDEAAKLIGLVELLIQDWYITREDRKNRLAAVIEIGKAKKEAKENPPAPETQ